MLYDIYLVKYVMKIFDCFPFHNELDLLEIRLAELYNKVDHFVIIESNQTFTSNPKPFHFEDNKSRYAQFLDKIIYIKVEDMPEHPDAWVNDRFQRDQIFRGIADADPNDLILISDLDEIIRPAAVDHMINSSSTLFALRMTLHNFRFNYVRSSASGKYDVWGMAGRRHLFDDIKPDAFRQLRFNFFSSPYQYQQDDIEVVEHAGWHFGYMGDKDWLLNKARSFAHQEVNHPDFLKQIDPEASIAERKEWNRTNNNDKYTIVELDNYFPKTLVDNKEKYSQWILSETEGKIVDFLPKYPYNQ